MAAKLGLTRPATLLGAAALGAAGAWLLTGLADYLGTSLPLPGMPQVSLLVLIAVLLVCGAYFAHRFFHRQARTIRPGWGLALVALAKACCLGGAALAGGYLCWAGLEFGHWAILASRYRGYWGIAAGMACLAVMTGGLFLERESRYRHGGDDSD